MTPSEEVPAAPVNYEQLLLDNLDIVKQAVRYVARRYSLPDDDRDELLAAIQLKLIESDYEVFRKFRRTSSLRTYLTSVVLRHFLDERNARWGKWRPSRVAQKLGGVALRLDELLSREGFSLSESIQLLRLKHGVTLSDEDISNIARQLPRRTGRHFVGADALEHLAAPYAPPATALEREKAEEDKTLIEDAFIAALERCTDEDLLILRYYFDGDLHIVTIARLMGVPAKPLYRRLEKLMQGFRSELEARSISREDAMEILQGRLVEFRPILELARSGEMRHGPSHG